MIVQFVFVFIHLSYYCVHSYRNFLCERIQKQFVQANNSL